MTLYALAIIPPMIFMKESVKYLYAYGHLTKILDLVYNIQRFNSIGNVNRMVTPTNNSFCLTNDQKMGYTKLLTDLGIDFDDIDNKEIILHIEPKRPFIKSLGKQLLRNFGTILI